MKTGKKNSAGLINRVIKTTCVVLLIFFPFGIYYLDFFSSLAILSGAVWCILNLILISLLVRSVIRPDGPQTKRAVWICVIKFPVLYFSGFLLLKIQQFQPLYLIIGFSGVLAIIVLKLAGGMIIGSDKSLTENRNPEGISAL